MDQLNHLVALQSGAFSVQQEFDAQYVFTSNQFAQYLFIFLFIASLIMFSYNKIVGIIMIIVIGMLFNTRFINPMGVHYQHWKASKQMIYG